MTAMLSYLLRISSVLRTNRQEELQKSELLSRGNARRTRGPKRSFIVSYNDAHRVLAGLMKEAPAPRKVDRAIDHALQTSPLSRRRHLRILHGKLQGILNRSPRVYRAIQRQRAVLSAVGCNATYARDKRRIGRASERNLASPRQH